MGFWDHAKIAVRESDIVAEVLDARMPELSRNWELEDYVRSKGKELVFVLNKSDLISREGALQVKKKLGKNFVFVSGKENLGMRKLKEKLYSIGRKIDTPFRVCFIGYPNVGKSSVINALSKGSRAKVSNIAGTTKGVQWIRIGDMKVIDSPGVIPFDERDETTLAMLGAKNPEKLRNPEKVAFDIIGNFLEHGRKKLEGFYNIKADGDAYEVFLEIGKAKKLLLKGGITDERRTALTIIRDWQSGKIVL